MIIVFLLSAAWTFMLAAIQVDANFIANAIMNTTHFDNGQFWLLPKPEAEIVISSTVLLLLFGVGYLALAITMVFFYRSGRPSEEDVHNNASNQTTGQELTQAHSTPPRNTLHRLLLWVHHLPVDVRQHYFTAALDLPKLIFQSLTLYTYLQDGFPTPIIYCYAVLLLLNWLVACYRSQHYVNDPNLIIARLYYTFDLFFAVFAPLVVLVYFITSFQFDRAEFMTRMETLTPTLPVELKGCHSLQQLILVYTKTEYLPDWMSEFTNLEYIHVEGDFTSRSCICNFIYTVGSMQSTTDLCSKYDKCVIPSYHWNFNEKHCTCLVFVDRETSPKAYSKWTDPEDTTSNLAELAIAGELRIVQIINRAVPELPEELTNCRDLEQLILIYTKTTSIPEWVAEFSHLEYFHLEGDFTSRRLATVADGIFDNMPHLTFFHLGGIPNVEKLPSLFSLTRLRYLTLAVVDSLKEIPSFEGLSELGDLDLVHAPRAPTLPP
ncbi:uncharacterized protein IUM83_10090 [Phytophthora cinnamomi]|uniref:uncharacterized protein n=1 Tax=Phytophthora cinnamomi TaxID=4785 RepID=UPI00355A6C81|nr:hypothetical protein IUM83_10090 [Phytophthora cinnamomi]